MATDVEYISNGTNGKSFVAIGTEQDNVIELTIDDTITLRDQLNKALCEHIKELELRDSLPEY